jgi:hypothetical protein
MRWLGWKREDSGSHKLFAIIGQKLSYGVGDKLGFLSLPVEDRQVGKDLLMGLISKYIPFLHTCLQVNFVDSRSKSNTHQPQPKRNKSNADHSKSSLIRDSCDESRNQRPVEVGEYVRSFGNAQTSQGAATLLTACRLDVFQIFWFSPILTWQLEDYQDDISVSVLRDGPMRIFSMICHAQGSDHPIRESLAWMDPSNLANRAQSRQLTSC